MQWELILALVIGVPIILFPAAYVWYLNIGGLASAVKEARAKRAKEQKLEDKTQQDLEYENALVEALKRRPWDD